MSIQLSSTITISSGFFAEDFFGGVGIFVKMSLACSITLITDVVRLVVFLLKWATMFMSYIRTCICLSFQCAVVKLRPKFVATSNLVLALLTETYGVLGGDINFEFVNGMSCSQEFNNLISDNDFLVRDGIFYRMQLNASIYKLSHVAVVR